MNIAKQVRIATNDAEGVARLFSDLRTRFVCNGQGRMSQQYFAELLVKRAAAC